MRRSALGLLALPESFFHPVDSPFRTAGSRVRAATPRDEWPEPNAAPGSDPGNRGGERGHRAGLQDHDSVANDRPLHILRRAKEFLDPP